MTIAKTLWALLMIVLLAACAAETEQAPGTAAAPADTVAAAAPTNAPTEPSEAPTETAEADVMPELQGEPAATAQMEDTESPTEAAPTETAAPTESAEAESVAVNGRTEDGAYFLGREDAPVTIIDYSDFL